ncbi:hypothetical protein PUT78_21490 [Roseinatronobacter sp. HJB301]|uniref:Uncharacterized protein n=1 Tax=Roseinatronobacter alkalisoli TaxID=3028235 RepID=A0ABT5THH4_9RHOB|nr:hypothetical protein [Roseinatronobacter sp. HJB301]
MIDLIDHLRSLSPALGAGEVLFIEAEAALGIGNLDRAEAALTQFVSSVGPGSELYTAALEMLLDMPDLRDGAMTDGARPSGEIVVQDWSAHIHETADEPENRICSASPRFEPRASMMISRGSGWIAFHAMVAGYHEELDGYRLRIDGPEGRTGIAHFTLEPSSYMEPGIGELPLNTPREQEDFLAVLEHAESASLLWPQGDGAQVLGTFSLRGAAQAIRLMLDCEL